MSTRSIRLVSVLFAMVFVAGLFHHCADLTPGRAASHACPICSSGAWAIPAHAPDVNFLPVARRMETVSVPVAPPSAWLQALSSRAPPAA
jgi:hypothetical protein